MSREAVTSSKLAEICGEVLKEVLSRYLDDEEDYNTVFDYSQLSVVKSFMLRELERSQAINPYVSTDILIDRAQDYLRDYRLRNPDFPKFAIGYGSPLRAKRK